MLRNKSFVIWLVISFSVFFLTGCGGGGARFENPSTQTLGQELTDLDKAYKSGILSEKEYKKAKAGLLKKYK